MATGQKAYARPGEHGGGADARALDALNRKSLPGNRFSTRSRLHSGGVRRLEPLGHARRHAALQHFSLTLIAATSINWMSPCIVIRRRNTVTRDLAA